MKLKDTLANTVGLGITMEVDKNSERVQDYEQDVHRMVSENETRRHYYSPFKWKGQVEKRTEYSQQDTPSHWERLSTKKQNLGESTPEQLLGTSQNYIEHKCRYTNRPNDALKHINVMSQSSDPKMEGVNTISHNQSPQEGEVNESRSPHRQNRKYRIGPPQFQERPSQDNSKQRVNIAEDYGSHMKYISQKPEHLRLEQLEQLADTREGIKEPQNIEEVPQSKVSIYLEDPKKEQNVDISLGERKVIREQRELSSQKGNARRLGSPYYRSGENLALKKSRPRIEHPHSPHASPSHFQGSEGFFMTSYVGAQEGKQKGDQKVGKTDEREVDNIVEEEEKGQDERGKSSKVHKKWEQAIVEEREKRKKEAGKREQLLRQRKQKEIVKRERQRQEQQKRDSIETEEEKGEREKKEWERREREKHEIVQRIRKQREREKEKREREKREREKREREQQEREQREREQQEREQWEREQREREQQEREQREREQREREQREREQAERESSEREQRRRRQRQRERRRMSERDLSTTFPFTSSGTLDFVQRPHMQTSHSYSIPQVMSCDDTCPPFEEETPPYRARLHKYLDLMSYDPRVFPCLRFNRTLLRDKEALAESIRQFQDFQLFPEFIDPWSLSRIDDKDYEDATPELLCQSDANMAHHSSFFGPIRGEAQNNSTSQYLADLRYALYISSVEHSLTSASMESLNNVVV